MLYCRFVHRALERTLTICFIFHIVVMPQEINDVVRFILDVLLMTGQVITLESGQHLGWARSASGSADKDLAMDRANQESFL